MQAIAPKQKLNETPVLKQSSGEARISLRAVTGLEIASIISTVLITTWGLIPLQPRHRWLIAIPTLLAIGLMINSHYVRKESPADLGLSTRHFGRAVKLLIAPTVLTCLIFATIGYLGNSFHLTSHFWANLVIVPMWALVQQYVLQAFIYRRLRWILHSDRHDERATLAILATAAIFALVHAPNPTLVVLTFLGALIWCWVYERAPNLYAIALSHAAISILLMTSLPPWLLQSMSVGYKHFLYQKF